ncbi:MAG: metallothionein [Geminocystis sp.]|nr:metallothionein [Geminocystis sp.]HIK36427.1 metallothionein [Geminocystis sp. M7585_C2015_104]MCS7147308.1 metallothionein [Geminocystis sp.]MCX8078808.1 metallothionein [Geminocystis sp.]MDW8116307.1 metallothionein [Geminocystis sp.]
MTTTTVTQMKCACPSCLCIVDISSAIEKGGQYYCSTACAEGHKDGDSCGHHGCNCHA